MNPYQDEAKQYVQEHFDELCDLVKQLCRIPAPSGQERPRAEFCLDWLRRYGAEGAWLDDADNAILPLNTAGKRGFTIFSAHTDTVFPDQHPLPVREIGGHLCCPGIYDDTANVAVLLMAARFLLEHHIQPARGMLIVADSGEEGLGNLRGCRRLLEEYGKYVGRLVSFDCTYHELYCRAVGSSRYRVIIRTQGGHSYFDYGNRSAIHQLSRLIDRFSSQPLPSDGKGSKTTCNVGLIRGGTSVNTIAQEASMVCEYRSDSAWCLEQMDRAFQEIIAAFQTEDTSVEVIPLGKRPCAKDVDPQRQTALTELCSEIISRHIGREPALRPGSTDCNVPLSLGIPAVSFGLCSGEGAHTREEWLDKESLRKGLSIALDILLHDALHE